MLDDILTEFLGCAPTPADRAIYADQTKRLAALAHAPLLPVTGGLQKTSPFGDLPS